ncbi:MAG: hypothetical protein QF479_05505 [Candidatus Poseidoniaceae archaeon]|nr:hypothetical protein [Candidatus Poseidoniaceae archaeon]
MSSTITLPNILIERLVVGANEQELSISQYCQLLLENYFQDFDNQNLTNIQLSHPLDSLEVSNLDPSLLVVISNNETPNIGALSGHINRLFPLKFGCRFLWSLLKQDGTGPTVSEFNKELRSEIISTRAQLKIIDENCGRRRGDRIHSSFPNNERYAINRFLNNYMVRLPRGTEKNPTGALYDFGLITIVDNQIQFTEIGRQFVLLPNPIIDYNDGTKSTLSVEEQMLLVSHLKNNMGKEWKFIRHILDGIHIGSNTPNSLLTRISRRYGEGTNANWSTSVIPHMRSGVLGRIQSLGFIDRVFTANKVEYVLTLAALQIIDGD